MKVIKVNQFKVNKSLSYLIQQITKDSTQEILGYFFGISSFVADEVFKKSKASYANKDIVLFYKDTPITFKIKMHCGSIQVDDQPGYWSASVGFPTQADDQDITELMTKVMEVGLGLMEVGLGLIEEEAIAPFEKPVLQTPACLRKVRIAQDEQRK